MNTVLNGNMNEPRMQNLFQGPQFTYSRWDSILFHPTLLNISIWTTMIHGQLHKLLIIDAYIYLSYKCSADVMIKIEIALSNLHSGCRNVSKM